MLSSTKTYLFLMQRRFVWESSRIVPMQRHFVPIQCDISPMIRHVVWEKCHIVPLQSHFVPIQRDITPKKRRIVWEKSRVTLKYYAFACG